MSIATIEGRSLPDVPADQIYKKVKQIDPNLQVIVITGYSDSEMLDRILQVSPFTLLKKPLRVEQLNQTVMILGHNSPESGVNVASGNAGGAYRAYRCCDPENTNGLVRK